MTAHVHARDTDMKSFRVELTLLGYLVVCESWSTFFMKNNILTLNDQFPKSYGIEMLYLLITVELNSSRSELRFHFVNLNAIPWFLTDK